MRMDRKERARCSRRVVSWRTSCVNAGGNREQTMAASVETLGVDLRTRVKRLGAKKKQEEGSAMSGSRSLRRTRPSKRAT